MSSFTFSAADYTRYKITQQQAKEIQKLYQDAYKRVKKEIEDNRKFLETGTGYLRDKQLNDLKNSLLDEMREIDKKLNVIIPKNMENTSKAVLNNIMSLNKEYRIPIGTYSANVPTHIISGILDGSIYQKGWSLSGALWKDLNKNQSDINKIVAEGVTLNKSTYEIAKDLEKYVDPNAAKPWDWSKVYPGVKKKIDYNAQRLARTLVSHAYQKSLVDTCRYNPFVTAFIWHMMSDYDCDICKSRDGKLFAKDSLPLDHPNGFCTYEAYIPGKAEDREQRILDWIDGKPDAELERYADYLGYNAGHSEIKRYHNAWYDNFSANVIKSPNNIDTHLPLQSKSYTVAKSINEAQQYAKEYCKQYLGDKTFKGVADFKGISLDNANDILRGLNEIYNNFDDMPKIGGIKVIDPDSAKGKKTFTSSDAVMAYSPVEHGIYINKKVLKSATSLEEHNRQAQEAWDVVMANIDSLKGNQKELALRYKQAGRSLVGDGSAHDCFVHEMGHHSQWEYFDTKTNNLIGSRMKDYAGNISGYATASKSEYFAESFSAYCKGERDILDPEYVEYLDKKRKKE